MNDGVRVDTEGMAKVAAQIDFAANVVDKTIEHLYTKINAEIGEDAGHPAWYGPQAAKFAENVNAKKDDFKIAVSNIRSCADNLSSQASAWNTFEGSE